MAGAGDVQAAALSGWLMLAALGAAAAGLLLIGLPRGLWTSAGVALMLGAAGYAVQGRPALTGHPVRADADPIAVDPDLTALRDDMVGRYRADTAYLVAADAMTRIGNPGYAVQAILGGIDRYPDSMALWTGLGMALATHDGGQVSPSALLAFRRAASLAPAQPAPPFFLGLAYIRAGDFIAARGCWARALALTPARVSYRPAIALRLALLDRFLAAQARMPG